VTVVLIGGVAIGVVEPSLLGVGVVTLATLLRIPAAPTESVPVITTVAV
jgi:hypothetical protein